MQKLDRTSIIVILLCIASFAGWQWYMNKYHPVQKPATSEKIATVGEQPQPATPKEGGDSQPAAPKLPITTTPEAQATSTLEPIEKSLSTAAAEYIFSNDSGGLDEVVLLTHYGEDKQSIRLNANRTLPVGAIGFSDSDMLRGFSIATPDAQHAIFSTRTEDGLEIVKRFVIPEKAAQNYLIDLEVTFRNVSDKDIVRSGWFLTTGGAAPIHSTDMPMYTRFEWMRNGKMRTTDVNWFSASSIPILGIPWKEAKSVYQEKADKIAWVGVTSQYFAILVSSPKNEGSEVWAQRFDWKVSNGKSVFGIEGGMGFAGFTLAPGESRTTNLSVYAGPKDYELMKGLGGEQEKAINFGFFKPVSLFLLWSMNKLYALFGNYAISIIVLTLLIKSALWPLQNKATQSMKKMAVLSPKIKELREKFKDDPQKMNQEMMKMYREYSINPFGGCLPMLIQVPIFFGFYSMLGSTVQLRNSSFLWVQDLSQPDTIFHLAGIPINILPLLMAVTMVWQMVISPKSGDATQQRIMYFMPIIFIVFAYNYASALSLYWTTQNLFSIVQLYLTRDKPVPKLEKRSNAMKRIAAETKKQRRSKQKRP